MTKPLSRRHVLRAAGACIGLPMLDAMAPEPPQSRLIVVYAPSGKIMTRWTPAETGADFAFPRTLKPMEKHREHVLVLSGLAAHNGNALGDGPGDHARAASTYLTGAHPKKTEGAGIRNGVSMDQIAARELAASTRVPSLEITCEDSRQLGSCDSYSCVYQSISWKSDTQPMPPEMKPRNVFDRMFRGANLTPEQRASRRGVLDLTLGETRRLARDLGGPDRRKLDEYLTAVREVEQRMDRIAPPPGGALAPAGIPPGYREHARLMFDLSALAFTSRSTRVITFMLAREGGLQTYPEAGVPEAHHSCTHHRNDPEMIEKVVKVNEFHVAQFSWFIDRLKSIKEGEGTLLDHTTALYGASLGEPNVHDHDNLPTMVVGGGVKGRHVRLPKGTPVTNLHLSLLDKLGVRIERLGDSTGRLSELA